MQRDVAGFEGGMKRTQALRGRNLPGILPPKRRSGVESGAISSLEFDCAARFFNYLLGQCSLLICQIWPTWFSPPRPGLLLVALFEHSLAAHIPDRNVAFYRLGPGKQSMLGLWWQGHGPQSTSMHIAFRVSFDNLMAAQVGLKSAGIVPLDFYRQPSNEPSVLAWMPAAAVYFLDPDGHLLEYISLLDEQPLAKLGVVTWSEWRSTVEQAVSYI